MDMVLTNNPCIDEGQIMIFIKAGDSKYGFEDSHSSLLCFIRFSFRRCAFQFARDDKPDMTDMLKMALENAGFSVDIFNDPLNALECFKPNLYDLVILDVMMPE
jgi:hypothetical protein